MADAAPGGEMVRVRFELELSVPPIWRTLDLGSSMSLDRVHDIVQAAFGWKDAHLHRFADRDPYERLRPVDGEVDWPLQWLPRDLVEDPEDRPEEELDLGTLLAQGAGTAFYEYDFGDSWLLRMQLLESRPAPAAGPAASVVDGARRGPLEDSGGVPGYEELLAVLADPADPEHAESREWVAEMTGTDVPYDPEEFDLEDLHRTVAAAPRGEGFRRLVLKGPWRPSDACTAQSSSPSKVQPFLTWGAPPPDQVCHRSSPGGGAG